MRKIVLILLLSSVILMGCWDRQDLEEFGYIVAMGIDLNDDNQHMDVTFQIANPEAGETQTAGATDEPPSEIITITAPDFIVARDMVNSFISREVVFTHMKVLVVSEELARSDQLVDFIKPSIRDREFDRRLTFIVSKEKASSFLRANNPTLETRPHKYFEMMKDRWRESGFIPEATMHDFLHRLEEDQGLFLAIYSTSEKEEGTDGNEARFKAGEINKEGGNPVQSYGAAVIKKGKMIDSITAEETRLSLMLRPYIEVGSMIATFQDPNEEDKHITVRILNEKSPEISINTDQDNPIIEVILPIRLEVLAIKSEIDYIQDLRKQEELKNSIENQIKISADHFIKKTQEQFKADPFHWSLIARKNFFTIQQYSNYDWMSKYPSAEVNVSVEVNIKGFGKQLSPLINR
ncbi:Ger(x)C family spore germination protein [Alkalihalobacillus sp. LMS39]|uniref:Ger(x)C family spore germination protein n=1 Tax=Alkalihalobacillus sp. LMS39 TaxID=2924032 RepID=UPI001FB361A6|nr:Ger(x)C family spore germination protein [Alkalihalobacillus sp. LMS39]UOE94833.1 Ger(x)C family spore germination protein [Alkalihalobacillus sp. LMS39]